jgi:plastocyanin
MLARTTLLVLLTAVALAGCGERRTPGNPAVRTTPTPVAAPATPSGRGAALIDVSLVEYALQPAVTRLSRAGLIEFVATNDGQTRHALAVDGPAGEVETVALRPGERTTIALRLPRGTYRWYCPVGDHARRGMEGLVRVGE